MKYIDASVIIPTFNRPKSLAHTLEILAKGSKVPKEIIIVDQSEKTEKVIEALGSVKEKFPGLKLIYTHQDMPSSSLARNRGMQKAVGKLLVFMDDDVDVLPDTFHAVEEIFRDDSIAMLGGLDENAAAGGKIVPYLMGVRSFWKRDQGHVTKAIFGRYPDSVTRQTNTEWAMGYFFVVRKELVNKWQLEWNKLFMGFSYAEDLDFTYSYFKKAEAAGYRCVLDPRVTVRHQCSQEWRVASKKSTYMFVFHREYLSYKFFPEKISSRILTRYVNAGFVVKRFLKHDNAKDMIRAQRDCDRYRRDIRQGKMHYELFE